MNTPSKPLPITSSSRSRHRPIDQPIAIASPASLRVVPDVEPLHGPKSRRRTSKCTPTPTHVAAVASVTMADRSRLFTHLARFIQQCGLDVPTYLSAGLDGTATLTDGHRPLLLDLLSASISESRQAMALMRPLFAGLVQEQVWLLLLLNTQSPRFSAGEKYPVRLGYGGEILHAGRRMRKSRNTQHDASSVDFDVCCGR